MKVKFGASLILILAVAFTANAKDLTHRLGVGYKNQFYMNAPAVAMQYYPNPSFGLSGAIAVDTTKNDSKFGLMAKLYRIVFAEKQMNFYMGGGAGMLSDEVAGKNNSGFELNAFVGGEFFIPGLDSLGFSFESGVGVVSMSNGSQFRTYGDSPLRAGIVFYF